MTSKECTVCYYTNKLIKPPKKYKCDHEVCRNCWETIAKTNPCCPYCRIDLTKWWLN